MARRSLWCSVALLLALLFVTANGLRGSAGQVEGHETRTISRSRGGSRFNSKAIEGLETSTVPFSSTTSGFASRSRNGRRGNSRSEDTSKLTKIETTTLKNVRLDHEQDIKLNAGNGRKSSSISPVTSSSFDRRRLSANTRKSSTENSPTTVGLTVTEAYKDQKIERENIPDVRNKKVNQEAKKIGLFRTRNGSSSRRGSSTTTTTEQTEIPKIEDSDKDRKFDTTGPSVFSGTTEIPRSRTGRKIQTTLSSRDLKSGLPISGRFSTSRQNTQKPSVSLGDSSGPERRSDDFSTRKRGEIVPAGSESISVDVPLTGKSRTRSKGDNSPLSLSLGLENSLAPSGRDRRSRGRSSDEGTTESSTGSRSPRRGSSRFPEISQVDNSLEKNVRSRNETPRSRNSEARIQKSELNEVRSRTRGRSHESTTTKSVTSSGRSELSGRNSSLKVNTERRGRQGAKSSTVEIKKLEPEIRTRSRVNSRSTGTNLASTTVATEESTVPLVTAESATVSTQVISTLSSSTIAPRSTRIQERTESTTESRGSRNRGRTTTVIPAGRKVPKEDFFNHGLGFRGRKIVTESSTTLNLPIGPQNPSTEPTSRGNPGWTLKRRPGYRPDETLTTTSSPTATVQSGAAIISNEIPTSNDQPESTTSSMSDDSEKGRGSKTASKPVNGPEKSLRGGKIFPKNSIENKANGDPDEGENYPADFKAKLAQLKNSKVKEATARPGLGELSEKYTTRHTRSTSVSSESRVPDEEIDETTLELSLPMVVSTIPIITTSIADLSITEIPNVWTSATESGLFKKRPATDPQYIARSRQKLESATKLVLKHESNNDDNVTKSAKRSDIIKRTSKVSTTVKTPEDRKPLKFVKRFGASKLTSRTEQPVEITTVGRTERKSLRVNKIGKIEEKIEITTLSQIDEENDLIEKTTVSYIKEHSTVKKEDSPLVRTQPTKPWILSRRAKELPRENISTTTRRTRAWNSAHIDKNFQEPVQSENSDDSLTPRPIVSTTKKSRVWHAVHNDKNFEAPVRSENPNDPSTQSPPVSTTKKSRVWHAAHNDKNFSIRSKKLEDVTRRSIATTTTTRKTRAWNVAYIDKNWEEPTRRSIPIEDSTTMKVTIAATTRATVDEEATKLSVETSDQENVRASSRYMRKKSDTFKPFEPVPKIVTTEKTPQTSRNREFRPRTATYRRHSEPPTVMIVNAVPAEKSFETNDNSLSSISITPKMPVKFNTPTGGSESSSTQRSARQEPTMNVEISTDNETPDPSNGASGIIGISNGNTGNSGSNIFNPTRSTFLLRSNATFLEQLRSTVAPLLGALGNRSPIFAGAYSNVNNSTGTRVTPSGSPPRFSARYKGAELFVRRPNVLEPAGPFLTSSTTPFTPTQNSGSSPSISIESPGEPKVLTFYRALETASITNELEQTDVQQQQQQQQQQQFGRVAQVEQAQYATDSDFNDTTNANNVTIITTTTIPTSPLPINETTVETLTMDIGTITTIETSQISDTTVIQDNATPNPDLTTIMPDTTVNSISENDITNTEAISTTELPVGTTLEVTVPSTQSDTTTQIFSSSDVTSSMPAMTEMITETMTTDDIITRNDSGNQNTTIPTITGRIIYVDDSENMTMTMEMIGESTTLTSITNIDSSSSTISNEMIETPSTDRTNSELEMTTTVQPDTEVSSTTISTTMESSTVMMDEATITTETMSSMMLNDKENLRIITETGTSVPETTIATMMTDPVTISESTSAEITTVDMMTDAVTISESTTLDTTMASMMTDAVTIAESTTPETTTAAMMTDAVTISESTTPETTTAVMMTDAVTISESTTPETTTAVMMTDAVTISESTTPETTTAAMMTDAVTISESTTPETTTAVMMTGAVTISESTTPETTTAVMMTDPVTISESTTPDTTTAAMMTDAVTISESTTPDTTTAAMMTDAVTMSESTTPETTTTTTMSETITVAESTTPETTEFPSTMPSSSENPAEMTTMLLTTLASDETTTSGMMEIAARFGDFTSNGQVTTENELGLTEFPMLNTTSDSEGTEITNDSESLSKVTNAPAPSPSIVDMIGARLANNSDIVSIFDDKLMSQMMIRIMSVLFANSSEATGSLPSDKTISDISTTTQIIEQSNNTEMTSSISIDDVPQLLGGFLDNIDKNTSDVPSTNNGTEMIESIAEISNQPVEMTTMILEGSSSPEVTSNPVTTLSTTPSSPSQLGETTLIPSGINISMETSPEAPEDLALTLITDVTNVTTNQPTEIKLTTESTVVTLMMNVENPMNDQDVENINVTTGDNGVTTNNNVPDSTTTTSSPVMSLTHTNDNPNSLAGFQDTTTANAQRTADDDVQTTTQSSQTIISVTTPSSIPDPITIITEPSTTVTSMTTEPQTNRPETTSAQTTIVMMETTLQTSSEPVITTTEAPMTPSMATSSMASSAPETSTESMMMTQMVTMMMNDTNTMMNETTIAAPLMEATTTTAAPLTEPTTTTTTAPLTQTTMTTAAPLTEATTKYLGRFGNFRITPAPRFSVSSSTKTPLRDYLVYGIFPNKTIVRKRPEDNLIDARNVDSPYVIFGIFPDGKLVRKYPNGTVIPDPPTNPVEVVFSLSTTTSTTNRPTPVFIDNQLNNNNNNNQAYYYNQNAPISNNRQSSLFANFGDQPGGTFPSRVNLGLSDNTIGPTGDGPNFNNGQSIGTTMSDSLVNTRIGTSSNGASEISGVLTTTSGPVSDSVGPPAIVTPLDVNPQGGRIIQEKEREEASRSREAGGQRSTVYIGQEKFINYWSGGGNAANNNSRLVSVKINSVASSLNESPLSSSGNQQQTSFDILPNSQSGSNQVTVPPGFPWKDPLDQIFGITTDSSVITASVASNTLGEDSNPSRSPIMPNPINPLVEIFDRSSFTPGSGVFDVSSALSEAPGTMTSVSTEVPITTTITTTTTTTPVPITTTTPAPTTTTTTTTTTTPAPTTTTTTTTTTPAPTTTTTTTTPAPTTTTTTTTTTPAPTTTTTTPAPTTTTTTPAPTTTTTTPAPTTTTTTTAAPTTTTPIPTTMTVPGQTAFGTTFDDLAFLNSLLQKPIGSDSTPKTLTEVEQLLANKILSLALGKPGPTRSPKAIQTANASPNSIISYSTPGPSSQPIIIDLLRTTERPILQNNQQPTWRPLMTNKPSQSTTFIPTTTTNKFETTSLPIQTTPKPLITTRAPVVITARPIATSRPRATTTPAPPGFAASILQALFGRNPFAPSTTQRPVQLTRKPVQTTRKPIQTTRSPIRNIQTESPEQNHVTQRQVENFKIQSNTPNSLGSVTKTTVTTSTQRTSTYSSEDDAKFLAALLKNIGQADTTKSPSSSGNSQSFGGDDEAFLRAILNGQASVKSSGGSASGPSDAAFLAALLKAQGIEPSTPANRLREQLQSTRSSMTTLAPRNIPFTTKKTSPTRPKVAQTTWSPSSTYPPPLFSNFANFGSASQGPGAGSNNEEGDGSVRSQVFNVAIGATRAFSQFLGAAITGAAQQLQSFVRNGTS